MDICKPHTHDRSLHNFRRADFSYYESVLEHVPLYLILMILKRHGQCGKICFSLLLNSLFPSLSGNRKPSIDFFRCFHQKRNLSSYIRNAVDVLVIVTKYKHHSDLVFFRIVFDTKQLVVVSFCSSNLSNSKQLCMELDNMAHTPR